MMGKYTYKFNLSIGYPGADHTDIFGVEDLGYEEEEWDAISDEQREKELEKAAEEWAAEFIQISWKQS